MSYYGLFCFLGRGHLDPGLAIGRGLQARGHDVTVLHLAIAEAAVRAAGLRFAPIDRWEPPDRAPVEADQWPWRPWRSTIVAVRAHAARTLREGPAALRELQIDAVVADQLDVEAGTVAEYVGVPSVSVSCGPPLYLDASVPPPYFGWAHARGEAALARNRRGNSLVERLAAPVVAFVNAARGRLEPADHRRGEPALFDKRHHHAASGRPRVAACEPAALVLYTGQSAIRPRVAQFDRNQRNGQRAAEQPEIAQTRSITDQIEIRGHGPNRSLSHRRIPIEDLTGSASKSYTPEGRTQSQGESAASM